MIDNRLILEKLMNFKKEQLARKLTSKMSEKERIDFINNDMKWIVEGQ